MENAQKLDEVEVSGPAVSLFELQSVDHNLIAWMHALLDLTTKSRIERQQFSHVRWQLSKARRQRRLLVTRAYAILLPKLDPAELAAVRSLRSFMQKALETVSAHIAAWTLSAVDEDWDGYRKATQKLHASWMDNIKAEQRLLHALLSKHAPEPTTTIEPPESAPQASEYPRHMAELKGYGILDTADEPPFDEIVKKAANAFKTSIALVSLIDEDRQWFKARYGLLARETPRTISFCTHAIEGSDVFVVTDATQDERFASNPLVTGEPNIRFYAGAPLRTPSGQRIGTLCVIDTSPREDFSQAGRRILQRLAGEVMEAVEERKNGRAATKRERRAWTKREPRSTTWLEASVLSNNGREIPAVVTNMSTGGCRIRSSEPLTTGERVCIKVASLGEIAAHILWRQGPYAGAKFVGGTGIWEEESRP